MCWKTLKGILHLLEVKILKGILHLLELKTLKGILHSLEVKTLKGILHSLEVKTLKGILHSPEVKTSKGMLHTLEVKTLKGIFHVLEVKYVPVSVIKSKKGKAIWMSHRAMKMVTQKREVFAKYKERYRLAVNRAITNTSIAIKLAELRVKTGRKYQKGHLLTSRYNRRI